MFSYIIPPHTGFIGDVLGSGEVDVASTTPTRLGSKATRRRRRAKSRSGREGMELELPCGTRRWRHNATAMARLEPIPMALTVQHRRGVVKAVSEPPRVIETLQRTGIDLCFESPMAQGDPRLVLGQPPEPAHPPPCLDSMRLPQQVCSRQGQISVSSQRHCTAMPDLYLPVEIRER